ncbi:hypothetical protein [Alteromonas sp. MMG017]|uniref:hypothetical protein n=1 Tax=Alteromonas sp. MMG017 TaxID=2822692 RepID=UPI001FFC573F|nr:hypothetical protein [Alteromonas sp. MMG017]
MEKTEGGLTMIEKRAFKELAIGAGAIAVKIYTGSALSLEKINFDELEDDDKPTIQSSSPPSKLTSYGVFVFYLVMLTLAVWYLGK